MVNFVIRSLIIYAIIVVFLRLMGKRQIGEMQPYEFVITLVIAELACVPMSDTGIPLFYGIVPITVLFLAHFLLSFLGRKSVLFRQIVDGKSVMVITPDGVNYEGLKSLNMNLSDLLEITVNQGYYDLSTIYVAFLQTNGKLCIIPNASDSQPTCGDLKIHDKVQPSYATPIVMDGKYYNLDGIRFSHEKVEKILSELQIKSVKDIIVMTVDGTGKIYLKPKTGGYISKVYTELASAAPS